MSINQRQGTPVMDIVQQVDNHLSLLPLFRRFPELPLPITP
jgi:hypothetical protein